MQKVGTALPILYSSCPTPLPSGLRLVRGRLGWTHREREEEGETKEGRKEQRQEEEEKNLDSNYYPPSPMHVPSYEEEPPALVRDFIPNQP